MGQKEQLQKEIDRLERYAKFYLNILLALLSGLTGIIYKILIQGNISKNLIILGITGIIAVVFVMIKIKIIDKKENILLDKLGKEE